MTYDHGWRNVARVPFSLGHNGGVNLNWGRESYVEGES